MHHCLPVHAVFLYWSLSASAVRAGLVFMAFGFNLVDCGGLLGQRLGKNIDYAAMRSLKKAKSAAL